MHSIHPSNLSRLLFEWPIKKAPRLALPLFILLAALFHLSTIYLFNIVYQPPHVSKPIAAQVYFLLPGSPSSQQLAPWLDANDPSIFSPLKTVQLTRPKIEAAIYEPLQPPAPLRTLPPREEKKLELPLPPTNETALPQNILLKKSSSSLTKLMRAAPEQEQITVVELSGDLLQRAPIMPATLGYPELPSTIDAPLPPTKLTLNIDEMGIPRHVIVLHSSGNSAADEAATHWLMTRQFAPAAHETWGNLQVIWGRK